MFSTISCPLGCTGFGSVHSTGFAAVTATIAPCESCQARGGTSWTVKASEVAVYLDLFSASETVSQHADGLVVFTGSAL